MRIAAALLLLSLSHTVSAQEDDDGEAHRRALVLFQESSELYDAGDFEEAAVLLRQAYEHEPNPGILFNLARSLEGAGNLGEAADAYEQYLAESDPDDRGAIEARILTLRDHARRLDEQTRRDEEGAVAEPPPPLEAREPLPPPDEVGISWAPWVLAAVGVAAVGAGIVFGVRSGSLSDDAIAEREMQSAVDLHESAESSALLANILLIGGGVLSAVGLTWGIIDAAKSGGASAHARLTPGGVLVEGTF